MKEIMYKKKNKIKDEIDDKDKQDFFDG